MTTTAEGRNGSIHKARMTNLDIEPLFPGGEVTSFQGRTKQFRIETYRSGSENGFVRRVGDNYIIIPEHAGLVAVNRTLYGEVYPERAARNPELTTERVLKGQSYSRTISMLAIHEGIPVGYGIFPRLDIQGQPALYSSRGVVAGYDQEGVGTYLLERAIELHRRESARAHGRPLLDGMLMTQNWYSVRSLEHLKESGIIETIQPLDEPFDDEGKHILFGVHARVFVASMAIEESGLSRGELREVGRNEAATVPERGTRAYEIYEKMVLRPPYGIGLNPYAGDVWYLRFTFPQSLVVAAA